MRKPFSLILLGFILVIAVVSNPDQNRHQEYLKTELKSHLAAKMQAEEGEGQGLESLVLGLGKLLGGALIDKVINQAVSVDNYLFFSLTKIQNDLEEETIGIGIFGNIILFKSLDEVLEEGWLGELELGS